MREGREEKGKQSPPPHSLPRRTIMTAKELQVRTLKYMVDLEIHENKWKGSAKQLEIENCRMCCLIFWQSHCLLKVTTFTLFLLFFF